jgi:hypothetical protein
MSEKKISPGMMPGRRPTAAHAVPGPVKPAQRGAEWYNDAPKIERFYIDKLGALPEADQPAAYDTHLLLDTLLSEAGVNLSDPDFPMNRHRTRFNKQLKAYTADESSPYRLYAETPGLLSVIPGGKVAPIRKELRAQLRDDLRAVKVSAGLFVERLNHVPYRDQLHEAAGLLALRQEMQIPLPGDQYETAILPFVRLDERVDFSLSEGYRLIPGAWNVHDSPAVDDY